MSVPIPWCLTRFGACLRLNIEWSLIFFSIFFLLNKPFEFETGSTAAARAQQRKRDASAAEAVRQSTEQQPVGEACPFV
jgi:hypothetical protein